MLAGKSKGRNLRRQSYPQRRSSKVEDIAEDSEDEDTVSVPQKSEGKLIKVSGNTSMFSLHFTKRNNFCDFLFASFADIAIPKWGLLLEERICSERSKSFPF